MNGPGESPELFRAMREAQAAWKECKSRATTMSDIEYDNVYMMFFHAFVQTFDAWERRAPSIDDGVQPHFRPRHGCSQGRGRRACGQDRQE